MSIHHTIAAFTLVVAGTGFVTPAMGEDRRPNILVVMVDDMGYSDLGCYGSEIQTPNLDRLASDGIRYTRMYNTSKCWTTRISLLSGLYHHRSDRDFAHTAMAGEVLRPAGYHTWWAGKHHAGFNPHHRGFDHFSGFLGGAINFWNPGDKARDGEPEPGWRATYSWAFDDKIVKPYIPDRDFYATDAFTDWALSWLDESIGDDGGIEKPFFLYMAYNAPHWPLHAHPEDIAKYHDVYDVGYQAIRQARYKRQVELGLFDLKTAPLSEPEAKRFGEWASMPDDERHKESMRMATHAAMVDRVDQNVGRLTEKLKEIGEFENTLILFLVDNGASAERPNSKGAPPEPWGSVGTFEAIGMEWANVADTPLRFWKMTSYEGGINTPMIAHWPQGIGKQMQGRFYREPCHLIDLLPTWMELAGDAAGYPGESKQNVIAPIDGVSLTPSFSGRKVERKEPLFFQFGSGKAVHDGDWKLVRRGGGPWELHDLLSGRTETRDVASEHPDRVVKMESAWEQWYQECTGEQYSEPAKKPRKTKSPKQTKRKNIVLIMADDSAADNYGCYGSTFFKTPRLDELARTGVRFNHCYSEPVCTPSRVKIMTGRDGIRNYVAFGTLDKDETTFGTMMKNAGYATAIAGKWQLHGGERGSLAPECGFDTYCLWNYPGAQGSRFWNPNLMRDGKPLDTDENDFGPDLLTDSLIEFIQKNKERPFFAYYPMVLTHSPFVPTPDSKDRNEKDKLKNFRDMTLYADKCVGRLVDALEEYGLRENTVVIYTTDNGTHRSLTYPYKDEQRVGEKAYPTDGGTHAPLIVNCPGTVAQGVVSNDLVEFSDVLPTLAAISGATLPDVKLDGRSFWPQCLGQKGSPREWIFQYYYPKFTEAGEKHGEGVNGIEVIWAQNQDYKLYRDGTFYTVADRYETNPIRLDGGGKAAQDARRLLQRAIDSMPSKAAKLSVRNRTKQ